jgi:hypothetical protein
MTIIDMENLPEKVNMQSAALAIYNPTPGTKAIDIRRQMVQLPEVAKSLSGVEKYIFAASTKTQIAEIDDGTLVAKTGQMFRFIALDVGYIIPTNTDDWAYICTRLLDILKKYYSQMTLADIKLAFELATTGELDDYLPKDSQGNPDKKHYQQFNADYFAKILNAYRRKQNGVINKAYKALPEPKRELTPEQKRYYHNETVARYRDVFLRYKYTGRFELGIADGMFIYDWLRKHGLANEIAGTEDDRKQAYARYMQRVARGFVNKYEAFHVQKKGTDAPELDFTAYEIARDKEIKRTFDRMIADELQIENYLDFWK